jgi:UDP:flavonoid glycosyltransferase YjiC (YdhE family)
VGEPADAVVAELAFVGAAGIIGLPAEKRPFAVTCGIFPLGVSSRDTAPFGLGLPPTRAPWNRARNRLLTTLAITVLLAPMHREADRTVRRIGAPSLRGRFFKDFIREADLIAQFTVPEFEYPRSDAPSNLRFYGPVARGVTSERRLPSWWDRLDGRPLVHVSQGTVANIDFGELVAPTLAALGNQDVQIVVTTGGPPVSALPALPPNAFAAEFIPYDRLLPRTAVFVTNGGYGGLHYAMEYGVPVVVAGDTEDKPETAARASWAGIGINLRTGRPTATAVRRAVRRVLADPTYAASSARIGEAIRASRGADGLVADVEHALDAEGAPERG